METLLSFIQDYGYVFIFFATLLEGETVVALAGFAAYQGYLDFEVVLLVAFIGGMLGDQIFFYFGRFKGKQYIAARPNLNERAKKVQRLIEKYPNFLIFSSRFLYGFRMLIPIAFGTSKVSGIRFFVFNLLGAAVWSTIFTSLGYFLGTAIETYIGNYQRVGKYVLVGVIAGVILVQGIAFAFRRFNKGVERASTKASDTPLDNSETKKV